MQFALRTAPTEIVLEILTIAVRLNRFETGANLQLVSSWVRETVRPILFESVYLDYRKASEMNCLDLSTLTPAFIARVVKALFVLSKSNKIAEFVERCKGARTLIVSCSNLYHYISGLCPSHLGIDFCYLPEPDSRDLFTHQFSYPIFSRVTHLELYDYELDRPYHLIPCLTHLALIHRHGWTSESTRGILRLFQICSCLQEFLILFAHFTNLELIERDLRLLPEACSVHVGNYQSVQEDWRDHLSGINIWEKVSNKGLGIGEKLTGDGPE